MKVQVIDMEVELETQTGYNNHHQLQQQQQPSASQLSKTKVQYVSAATGLILTYLIEISVQIYLTIYSFRVLSATLNWDWPWFLTISLMISSLLVSGLSIVWVCRGLDFVGRLCAQFLCYTMHFLLLGLVWRYLKLAFAYDYTDVQEFLALRIFQVYIQSLPLTSIHLAWLITFSETWNSLNLWLIVAEGISVLGALLIGTFVKSIEPKGSEQNSKVPKDMTLCKDNLKFVIDNNKVEESNEENTTLWCSVLSLELNVMSRGLLLCARVTVIALVIIKFKMLSILPIGLHLFVSICWMCYVESEKKGLISCSNENESETEISNSPDTCKNKDAFLRCCLSSYILFWDINNITNYLSARIWTFPVMLAICENATVIFFYWHNSNLNESPDNSLVLLSIISGACLIFGTVLFLGLNLFSYNYLVKLFGIVRLQTDQVRMSNQQSVFMMDPNGNLNNKQDYDLSKLENGTDELEKEFEDKVQQSLSSSSLNVKNLPFSSGAILSLHQGKPMIMPNNYSNISEVSMKRKVNEFNSIGKKRKNSNPTTGMSSGGHPEVSLVQRASPPTGSHSPSPENPSTCCSSTSCSPLANSGTWVPDTCCNDSNGSSNSRNTNTLQLSGSNNMSRLRHSNHELDKEEPPTTHFVFCYPEKRRRGRRSTSSPKTTQYYQSHENNGIAISSLPRKSKHFHDSNGSTKDQTPTLPHASPLFSTKDSFNSFRGNLTRSRLSTPVEIKKASRVIMNNSSYKKVTQSDSRRKMSRCSCQEAENHKSRMHGPSDLSQPLRLDPCDKLMEDTYGILICEGDSCSSSQETLSKQRFNRIFSPEENSIPRLSKPNKSVDQSIFNVTNNKRLKILCAKCFENHDPLLTDCYENEVARPNLPSTLPKRLGSNNRRNSVYSNSIHRVPPIPSIRSIRENNGFNNNPYFTTALHPTVLPSETTDYPSETEMTWTRLDQVCEDGDDHLEHDRNSYGSTSQSSSNSVASETWNHHRNNSSSIWTTSTMLPSEYALYQNEFPKEFTSREYVKTWLITNSQSQKQVRNNLSKVKTLSKCKRINKNKRKGKPNSSSNKTKVTNGNNATICCSSSEKPMEKRHGPDGRGGSPLIESRPKCDSPKNPDSETLNLIDVHKGLEIIV